MRQVWYGIGVSVELTAAAAAFLVAIFLGAGFLWVRYCGGSWSRYRHVITIVALVTEVISVLAITMSPTYVVQERSTYVPLDDIFGVISHGTGIEVMATNIAGNILMFVPFGFFLSAGSPHAKQRVRVLIFSIAFSVAIELTQKFFIAGRAFDVNDIIFNSLGSLLGCALWSAIARISNSIESRRRSLLSPPQ